MKERIGFIESKIRFLIYRLEVVENMIIQPYPKTFENLNSKYPFSSCIYIGLKYIKHIEGTHHLLIKKKGKCEVDLSPCVFDFESIVKDWNSKTEGMILPIIRPIKR
jgi:poly(A) polymerase Pap1